MSQCTSATLITYIYSFQLGRDPACWGHFQQVHSQPLILAWSQSQSSSRGRKGNFFYHELGTPPSRDWSHPWSRPTTQRWNSPGLVWLESFARFFKYYPGLILIHLNTCAGRLAAWFSPDSPAKNPAILVGLTWNRNAPLLSRFGRWQRTPSQRPSDAPFYTSGADAVGSSILQTASSKLNYSVFHSRRPCRRLFPSPVFSQKSYCASSSPFSV
jgi:hypothetical protein